MSHDYFVRITHPYASLQAMVSLWSLRCEKLVVYEHTGGKTEKVHCHILILGSNTHKKQLRNIGSDFVCLKGNELCSFKECVSWQTPVVYMTKGNLEPKFLKGFQSEDSDNWKSQWVPRDQYEKVDPLSKLYDDVFTDFVLDKTSDDFGFGQIKRHVRAEVLNINNYIWTQKCFNQYKTLVYSFVFRNNIPIPEGTDWKRWL